jgi:DNA-binding SARP family transcriptional activator
VKVLVLGPVELHGSGRALPLGTPKQKTALVLLLVRAGTIVPVDDLVAELWENDPPPSAVANVRMYANNLRRLLMTQSGAPILARIGDGYRLMVDPAGFDLAVFRRLTGEAREAYARGDLTGAVARFDGALAQWRGSPAAGVPAGRSLAAWRVAVQEERLSAVEDRAEALLGLNAHSVVSSQIAEVLSVEPLRERSHAMLIRARYQAGDVAGALAAYDAARRLLAEELGVEPGDELTRLQRAVLNRDPALAARTGAEQAGTVAPPPMTIVPRQLPADVPGFTGRAAHLRRLDRLVPEGEPDRLASEGQPDRLVPEEPAGGRPAAVVISAIAGTAGIGKTALAVHWAHRVADRFPDGQLYVNLRGFDPTGSPTDPADAVRGILTAYGVPPAQIPATLDAQAALYRSLLAGRRVLVVLDNARDAEQVRPLLPGAAGCVALVTSRNQLTPLVATDGAQPMTLDVLDPEEARLLLARRLGPERVAAEPDAAERIIAACARLPLALSIAAARARQAGLALATLADELEDAGHRLDALDAGDAVSQVRAVFSWSYTALTPAAARLFRLLGLHPGPDVSVPAVVSLAGEGPAAVRAALAELTRANLLTAYAGDRYALHDLLRAYAADLTNADADADAAVDADTGPKAALTRLLDHYSHTAYAADRLLYPQRDPIPLPLEPPAPGAEPERLGDPAAAMAWLTAERHVLLAAIKRAAAGGFDAHAWRLVWALDTFTGRRVSLPDVVELWQYAVLVGHRLPDPAVRACAHRVLGVAHARLARHDEGRDHLRLALDLYARAGDLVGQANTHRNLAYVAEREALPEVALDHSRQALSLYVAAGYRRGQALALNAVGWCHSLLGDHREALRYCDEALILLRELGDRNAEAATWDSVGRAHWKLGDHRQAVDSYRTALDLYRELHDVHEEATVVTRLGDVYRDAGDVAAAREAWQQALEIHTAHDHPAADAVRARLDELDRCERTSPPVSADAPMSTGRR